MTREEAIKTWLPIISMSIHNMPELKEAFDMAIKALEQEPRKGHWITTRTFMHDGEFYCDRCKSEAPNNKKWDYCPNCGADMREMPGRKALRPIEGNNDSYNCENYIP